MDFDDIDEEQDWVHDEPSELGFDPYSGAYIDDDPIDPYEYIGGDSDLFGEW